MKLAKSIDRLGTETAFEVLAKAKKLEAQGKEIVHLEIGEPDFETPNHIKEAAKKALDTHGYGMSSVRFICGTQDIHKNLENKISEFLGMEDTILYAAAFDANGGLFEPLLGKEDAIISDSFSLFSTFVFSLVSSFFCFI